LFDCHRLIRVGEIDPSAELALEEAGGWLTLADWEALTHGS
jgi:hypothetical protein